MHFANADPVLVHAVAGSGAGLIGDLAKNLYPKQDIDTMIIESVGYDKREYFSGVRGGVYFLKHAAKGSAGAVDGTAEFEFHPSETEGVIFWAIQDVGKVHEISPIEALFQLFFLSTRYELLGRDYQHMGTAVRVFVRLHNMSGEEQRNAGAARLAIYDDDGI